MAQRWGVCPLPECGCPESKGPEGGWLLCDILGNKAELVFLKLLIENCEGVGWQKVKSWEHEGGLNS